MNLIKMVNDLFWRKTKVRSHEIERWRRY